MEFALSDEEAMIADTVREFFANTATSARTREAMEANGIDSDLWSAFSADLGLAGATIPEEFGGAGLGMVVLALIAEAAGAQVAGVPLLGHVMVAAAIAAGGSEAQKAQWLPRLAAGELIAVAAVAQEVTRSGDRLSADVATVPHGGAAEVLLVMGEDAAWLVDLTHDGVQVTPHVTMDQTRPFAAVAITDVPVEALEHGAAAVDAALSAGWLCLAGEALGGAQAALDRTVQYSQERIQFGRPIGSFQAYKHRLADMMVEIEQARSAVYWAACSADEQAEDALLALHAAKAFCADTYRMCAGNMIQLHGGIGFTWEHDAHLFFKRAIAISAMLGDSDYHREAVARTILGESE